MRLDQIATTKDAQGRLTGVTATRAPTQAELAAQDHAARLAALEAAMKAVRPAFVPPARPQGYKGA